MGNFFLNSILNPKYFLFPKANFINDIKCKETISRNYAEEADRIKFTAKLDLTFSSHIFESLHFNLYMK